LSTVAGVHATFNNVVEKVGVDVAESRLVRLKAKPMTREQYLRGTETQGWSARIDLKEVVVVVGDTKGKLGEDTLFAER
jgi:hypothetical protein